MTHGKRKYFLKGPYSCITIQNGFHYALSIA